MLPSLPLRLARAVGAGALLLLLAGPVAQAASLNVTGTWKSVYHCGSGWCAGSDFPDAIRLTQAQGSSTVTGTDQIGSTVTGTLSGNALSLQSSIGSYTAEYAVTVSADGSSWSGTATDSNSTAGSDDATRQLFKLGGTISQVNCSSSGCSKKPLPNITVDATAADGSSSETTTAADGTYQLNLPPDTYHVEPLSNDHAFDPEFLDVPLQTADSANNDFTACGDLASADATSRSPNASTTRATASPACTLKADWTMPTRLRAESASAWAVSNSDGLPKPTQIYPKSWNPDVFITQGGKKLKCPANVRFAWTIDKKPSGAELTAKPKPGCSSVLHVTRLGKYGVVATKQVLKKGKWLTTKTRVLKTIDVRDWLIVGMGDSNGSGEGNPPFFFPRCNRSIESYQFQTALYIERQDPRSSVTFMFVSCSGASIEHLVKLPYEGTRSGFGSPLQPQLEQLAFALTPLPENKAPVRKVDAAIISVGVNNLRFGPLLGFCVKHPWDGQDPQGSICEDIKTSVKTDSQGYISEFIADPKGKTMFARLAGLQKALVPLYKPLAKRIANPIGYHNGGLGIKPNRVFMAAYPDFSHGDNGEACNTVGASASIAHWLPSTWEWLGTNGSLLNAEVAAASRAHGWVATTLNAGAFATSGYCSTHSLFVGIIDAVRHDDVAGPFHPNAAAHLVEAASTEPLICQALYRNNDCTSKP